MITYTATEQKLLATLKDGLRHEKQELNNVIKDGDIDDRDTLAFHMCNLRKKLNPIGENVICELHSRRTHYRHVRMLATTNP